MSFMVCIISLVSLKQSRNDAGRSIYLDSDMGLIVLVRCLSDLKFGKYSDKSRRSGR